MIDELTWAGPDPAPKSSRETARELAELTRLLESAADTFIAGEGLENMAPALRHAVDDLARCYARAVPLFATCSRMPPREIAARSPEFGALLAALAIAEARWIAALAHARAEWLFRASRDLATEE